LLTTRLLAVVALVLLAGLRYGEPIWALRPEVTLLGLGFGAGLLLCMGRYTRTNFRESRRARLLVRHATLTAIIVLPVTAMFLLADVRISRVALIVESAAFFGVLAINYTRIRFAAVISANVALFAVVVAINLSPSSISSFKERVLGARSVKFERGTEYVFSSRHDLKIKTTFLEHESRELGGAINLIDDGHLLLATGDGEVLRVPIDGTSDVPRPTAIRIPLNRDTYVHDVQEPSHLFRVTDVYLEDSNLPERRLFASHHYWDAEHRCVTLRLSEARINVQKLESEPVEWRTIYDSAPCLSDEVSADRFSNLSGGRIAFLPPSTLLLTVGSHNYEAVAGFSAFDASSYGKIIAVDIESGHSEVYSQGHRNPQGLLVAGDVIWETEHGPEGGDELNIIERGADYGWPRSTYGTAYGYKSWQGIVGPLEHSFGHEPVYAWVPSVGISNLIQVKGRLFTAWKGDLLIGTLEGLGTGRSLLRVKIREGPRAVLVEKIMTGRPIRDLVEDSRGRLILWDGYAALQFVEPGAHVFSACAGCHPLLSSTRGIGPDLMGIVGDKVARQVGYQYSDAMRRFGGRWTTDRLDAFLREPAKEVPGTVMAFAGVGDAAQRAEIVQYLAQLHTPRDVQEPIRKPPVAWWKKLLRPVDLAD
jgi:cytochrome c2